MHYCSSSQPLRTMYLLNLSQMNTVVEEKLIRQAKRQKRCVSPEQDDGEYSSIGCVEDYLSEIDDEECADTIIRAEEHLRNSVLGVRDSVLGVLQDKEEESLVTQSRLRSKVCESENQRKTCLRQALADEKLKYGISKVLSLIVQSQTILGRLTEERKNGLVLIERFIEHHWDDGVGVLILEFHTVLRHSFVVPPQLIYLPTPVQMPTTASKPKKRTQSMEQSRSVLTTLSDTTQDVLRKRLESPCNDEITAQLEAIEGVRDILQVWTDLVQRSSSLDEETLELYRDALQQAQSASVETVLWNFVYYLSLQA